jgi:hypothetical protein
MKRRMVAVLENVHTYDLAALATQKSLMAHLKMLPMCLKFTCSLILKTFELF